jgi:hypothetical protein
MPATRVDRLLPTAAQDDKWTHPSSQQLMLIKDFYPAFSNNWVLIAEKCGAVQHYADPA